MPIAVRSSVATGVAVLGVGALALAPLQPVTSTLSNAHGPAVFSTADVSLTAGFDPVTPWVDVFTAALANVTTIGEDWLADPAPALRQLGTNWFGYANTVGTALGGVATGTYTYLTETVPQSLSTAFQQIADGDLSGAAETINNALGTAIFSIGLPLFPVLEIPGKITDNLSAVVKAVAGIETLLPVLVGVLGPVEGGIQAFGDSAQAVLDASAAGDFVTAVNAAVNILPTVVGAVLNGYQDGVYPGLLSTPVGFNQGLAYTLLVTIPKSIATALGATPPTTTLAQKKAAPSAEAVAAEEPTVTEKATGTGHSKVVATTPAPAAAASADSTSAGDETGSVSESTPAVKDGNKVEPGQVTGSAARTAAGSSKPATAGAGKAKDSAGGSTGTGRSARQAAGAAK
ncbi:hypothetical protein [Mycobacterium sp. shizuoka-1]|uniref:hypothetical protein n=1 Tax=Mycobacterium sp. shizuoka-1 TaxID=2039281 RepID=UPI000C060EBF|nr:hypothetical protein [Mycobacterium sp. shizuoka-1]GAY14617.1 hypothetical protein MSZK_13430 [Mycobacterium sp. shizuoka-1]